MKFFNEKRLIMIIFLLPSLILLSLFTYIPAISMFIYSFTDWDAITPSANFIGIENYMTIASDLSYLKPILISIYYLIGSFFQIVIAIFLSTILSYRLRGSTFFKGLYFFPTLINSVAISFMFLMYYQPGGTLDSFLYLFGIENSVKWIGNPDIINVSLAYASVWRYIGLNIVMFSAAISSINTDLFEASMIDRASKWQEFRYIILPSIRKIIFLNLFLAITGALTVFEMPFIMTGGKNGSETFVIQSLNLAFDAQRAGLAAALSVILILIVVIISGIQKKIGGNDAI